MRRSSSGAKRGAGQHAGRAGNIHHPKQYDADALQRS